MSASIIIERTLPFGRPGRASSAEVHPDGQRSLASVPPPRVPRIARLMALALHIEALVQAGTIQTYAAAARLGHVSRARLSQILSLLHLAPDLQEKLLFLQRPAHGREPWPLRHVLTIAADVDWSQQRRRWRQHQRIHTTRRHAAR
jgi:hypothetical protein